MLCATVTPIGPLKVALVLRANDPGHCNTRAKLFQSSNPTPTQADPVCEVTTLRSTSC